MKYEIGQPIWRASWDAATDYVPCPDCAGTARVRVMLPDDSIVSVECEGCRNGYEGSSGYLKVYCRKATAKLTSITGVEMRDGKTEWQTADCYRTSEEDLFLSEAEAVARALVIAARADKEERDKINQKEKPLKSWAWHAHYHRREIKEAQRRIEYHSGKLAVASKKAKEDRKPNSAIQPTER